MNRESFKDEVRNFLSLMLDDLSSDPMILTRSMQRFFKVIAHVYLDIRKDPDVNAERTGESLVFGAFFGEEDETLKLKKSRSGGGGFKRPIWGGFESWYN